MPTVNERQWWVVWTAVGVLLFMWWSSLSDATRRSAMNSPDYRRARSSETMRDFGRGGWTADSIKAHGSYVRLAYQDARAEAYRRERDKRMIASVIASAAFAVWCLRQRRAHAKPKGQDSLSC